MQASVCLLTHVGRPSEQTDPLLISQGCYRSCLITSHLALGPLLARTLPFSEPYSLASQALVRGKKKNPSGVGHTKIAVNYASTRQDPATSFPPPALKLHGNPMALSILIPHAARPNILRNNRGSIKSKKIVPLLFLQKWGGIKKKNG